MTAVLTPRDSDRGFTLVELVLVLTLVAVLAAVAVPRFQGVRVRWRLEETARLLLADLRGARTEVVQRGGRIELALSSSFYEMIWRPPLSSPVEDWEETAEVDPLKRIVLLRREMPGAVRVTAARSPVVFEADGTSSGGELRVSSGTEEITILLDAASGSATLAGEKSR